MSSHGAYQGPLTPPPVPHPTPPALPPRQNPAPADAHDPWAPPILPAPPPVPSSSTRPVPGQWSLQSNPVATPRSPHTAHPTSRVDLLHHAQTHRTEHSAPSAICSLTIRRTRCGAW